MDSDLDDASCKTDSDGNPNIFNLEHDDDGLRLNDNWANPDNKWNPDNMFVFRLRNWFFSAFSLVAVFLFLIIKTFSPSTEHLADLDKF